MKEQDCYRGGMDSQEYDKATSADAMFGPRTFVQHNYVDHANDPLCLSSGVTANPLGSGCFRNASNPRFVELLHLMLTQVALDGNEHIVGWQPHGRAFVVHEPDEFVKQILPMHFKQTKIASFHRQLNMYGFARLTVGADRGGYYHQYFLRGRPDLCHLVKRTKVKGNKVKSAYSPHTEPDFYSMAPCLERMTLGVRALIPTSVRNIGEVESDENALIFREATSKCTPSKSDAAWGATRRGTDISSCEEETKSLENPWSLECKESRTPSVLLDPFPLNTTITKEELLEAFDPVLRLLAEGAHL